MKITYLNGRFVNHENAYVHIEDRGYQFSDGVYEVVLAKNRRLIDWTAHCIRLRRSLEELQIGYSFNDDILKKLVLELIEKNSLKDAAVYMQISRGVAKRDHGFPKGNVTPSVIMTANVPVFPSIKDLENGVPVITMPDIRWKRRDIKSISLLPNILAKQSATEQNAIEAIFIEDDGFITEGSSSNFFIFDKAGSLRTHPANHRILGGITRDGIINVARKSGFKVIEQPFRLADVLNANGAFISSTTKHILPVSTINGAVIGGGKACNNTQALIKFYQEYINSQVG